MDNKSRTVLILLQFLSASFTSSTCCFFFMQFVGLGTSKIKDDLKIIVFWDVMLCSLVAKYWHFSLPSWWRQQTPVKGGRLLIYRTIQQILPEDSNLHRWPSVHLKSDNKKCYLSKQEVKFSTHDTNWSEPVLQKVSNIPSWSVYGQL